MIEWLTRLRWLRVDHDRVRTTALGDATLAHLEQTTLEQEIPMGIVLNRGDDLATAKVIGEIANAGPCALVDPFFSIDSLLPLVNSTQVDRVLTSSRDQAKLGAGDSARYPQLGPPVSTSGRVRPFTIASSSRRVGRSGSSARHLLASAIASPSW